MFKKNRWWLTILLATLSLVLFFNRPAPAQAAVKASTLPTQQGLLLDLGRKPMTASAIKQMIKAAADRKFTYVVLYLSDNEHLSFQSKYLKNKATKTVHSPKTLKQLVSYARGKNVQLVPAVDMPSHSGAILRQLKKSHPKIYRQVKLDSHTLDYTKKQSVTLTNKLYGELTASFKKQPKRDFLLGADEVPGTNKMYKSLITYINQVNKAQNKRGFTTVVWNDSLLKSQLSKLNKNITVNYWSQSGNRATTKELTTRRTQRVSVNDLVKAKRGIVNANSYATYYQFQYIGNAAHDQYFISYLRDSYRPNLFNEISATGLNQDRTFVPGIKTNGTLVSLWGHDAQKVKPAAIVNFIRQLSVPK